MANIFQKIFLPEYKWRALDAIDRHPIVYAFIRWTKPSKYGFEDYKCSERKFIVKTSDMSITSVRHYDEQLERPEDAYTPRECPVFVTLDITASINGIEKNHTEYNTKFAHKVYEQMLREHEKRNEYIKPTKVR